MDIVLTRTFSSFALCMCGYFSQVWVNLNCLFLSFCLSISFFLLLGFSVFHCHGNPSYIYLIAKPGKVGLSLTSMVVSATRMHLRPIRETLSGVYSIFIFEGLISSSVFPQRVSQYCLSQGETSSWPPTLWEYCIAVPTFIEIFMMITI